MQRRKAHSALGRLAGGDTFSRRLETMVDRVSQHVRDRIRQALDDGLVDLGAFAFRNQLDLLAGHRRRLAHEARHPLEHRLHRLRADGHHAVLDLARQLLERFKRQRHVRGAREVHLADALREHGLVDDQLADEVDETVDALEVHANGRRRARGGFLLRGLVARVRVRRPFSGWDIPLFGLGGCQCWLWQGGSQHGQVSDRGS